MRNLLYCWMLCFLFGFRFLWFSLLNRKIWCSLCFWFCLQVSASMGFSLLLAANDQYYFRGFFFNLERQMMNLLNCWMLCLLFGFRFLWFSFLNRKIWWSLSFCFYVFKSQLSWVFFYYCAGSLWWQFYFPLKAGLWICLAIEMHELGWSEAWMVLVFFFFYLLLHRLKNCSGLYCFVHDEKHKK